MTTPILGIDPGLTGALALYTPETGSIAVEDMPTLRIRKKTLIDHYALARIVDNWAQMFQPIAWIEDVHSSPQQGVTSAFTFGRGYGTIIGICAAHFLRIEPVTPPVWKLAMRCRGEKDESRARAAAMFPKHSALFTLKKSHGRADAALIALYGSSQGGEARAA